MKTKTQSSARRSPAVPNRQLAKANKGQGKPVSASAISFLPNADFERKDADEFILHAPYPERSAARSGVRKRPKDVPAYLASLYEIPLLTAEQEVYLFRKMNYLKYKAAHIETKLHPSRPSLKKSLEMRRLIEESDEVRNQITRANLRLVVSISRRFADPNNSFDDLVGEGNIALMYAVDKFNYSRGFRFSTYATHAIQRSFFRSINRRQKETQRFYLGASDEQFVSLPAHDQDEQPVIDPTAYERLFKKVVHEMSHLLDDRERFILMARFGIQQDGQELTLKLLAEQLGICKERVRQLQNRALVKLQGAAEQIMSSEPVVV